MKFRSTHITYRITFLLICAFGSLLCQNLFAQPRHNIDSLSNLLNTAGEDTTKVTILLNLSSDYLRMSRHKLSKKHAEDALILAKNLGDSSGIAMALDLIGSNYKQQGNYNEALEYQFTALSIREHINDRSGIASCHSEIGSIYEHQSKFQEALQHHSIALDMHKESGNLHGEALTYLNTGLIYKKQGDYVTAVKHYLASMKISEKIKDKQVLGRAYSSLGNVYAAQRDFNESIKYHHAFLRLSIESGNKTGLSVAYLKIGEDYVGLRHYDRAMDTLMLAKQLCEEIGNKQRLASCLRNIGNIHMHERDLDEAIKNYVTALELASQENNKMEIALTSSEMGKAYLRLNQPDEAKTHLMNSLSLGIELGLKNVIKFSYEVLSRIESESGNHQQALVYYKLYTQFKDSLLNTESQRQIALLKEQFESEKKDKEIQLLRSENSILEHARKINSLLIKSQEDSLNIAQSEKEKIRLENEKFLAMHLFNEQQLELLNNEKRMQELQNEKDKADLAFQKAEAGKKQEQLNLLNKESDLRELELRKEKLTKNYFKAGLGLFLILSFFIYRNYQSRQEVKLLTLRNKIASDLHDDVGSTLSSISMFSQIAQKQSKEVIPALETIEDSSKKMLDAMADIVWTIDPENDQFEKIIMRMRSFAYELLGAKDIDFEFDTNENVAKLKLPMEARKNLYLVFKEATNNMVKYSHASRAKFAINGEKDKLTMVIQDNGKGFDTTKESLGNGLKNMKKRAAEMGAQLLINSSPDTGTMIKLELTV